MGIKVYGLPRSTNTARVLACLLEKGLDYELIHVDVLNGEHKQQPYLSLNPFGKIPAYVEDDATVLFESRAITDHIASKYKEKGTDLLGPELGGIAIVGLWMEVEAHQFDAPASVLIHESVMRPAFGKAPDEALVRAQCEKLNKVFDVYEERLSKCKYLAGDYFSLADLHHLPCLHYIMASPHSGLITSRMHVSAWWEDISSRAAWKKVSEPMKF
ncbi:glutathione S-transferase F13-like [Nymphaea colorata]|nr:glutathione S-transferase F13-like [Nymphaea colorata]